MKMLRTWKVIVKIGKKKCSLNSAIALQSFLSRVTHLSPSVPRAGGAQAWCLRGTMWPCSALHTSLVSPVCSLPFSHHYVPSTTVPTSFVATVPWGIGPPSGTSSKGKSISVYEERRKHLCAYPMPLSMTAVMHIAYIYTWVWGFSLNNTVHIFSFSCAVYLKSEDAWATEVLNCSLRFKQST